MARAQVEIERIHPADLLAVTRMAYANMTGVDPQFTHFVEHPVGRWVSTLALPLYFLTAGRGYKAMLGREMVGCAYLHMRQRSGYVFNVSVNEEHRRRGVARALMGHLEEVTRSDGRSWMALQVDYGNRPAEALYLGLGYRPHHPHFFHRRRPPALYRPRAGGPTLEPISPRHGERMYMRYRSGERRLGEAWALDVLADYEMPLPSGGAFWRCLVDGQEAGIGWTQATNGRLTAHLSLKRELWGQSIEVEAIERLEAEPDRPADYTDLYFGSSGHHELAAGPLSERGWHTRTHPRILMLKRLSG
jgi:aminoglycoside 3-N-acetyltransferase I